MTAKRILGIAILLVVVVGSVAYSALAGGSGTNYEPLRLRGYAGGEKIGFIEDPEVQAILKNRYRIELDVTKAGSLEMVQANTQGVDFLWPGSQVALDQYKSQNRTLVKEEVIFNSPIVIYSWDIVANALEKDGIVRKTDGAYYVVDFPRLIAVVNEGRTWKDVGVSELYGKVRIACTDPAKSNSGNQFAALVATTMNGGDVVDDTSVEKHLPQLRTLFASLGYMQSSSGDIFSQYLKQGVGAFPLVVGYENQIVEFSLENKQYLPLLKEKTRILYPQPTVWSSHPLIVLNDKSKRLADALLDPDIQRLAWSKHGFRTALAGAKDDPGVLEVAGIPRSVDMIVPMPRASVMDKIVGAIGQ